MKTLSVFSRSKIFLLATIIICFAGKVYAQKEFTVEGKVSDKIAGEPIEFASVYLSGTTFGMVTNDKGYFKISKIPTQQFDLVASIIGYTSQIIRVDLENSGNKNIDFKLDRITIEFKETDISGERPEEWLNQLEMFKKLFFGLNDYAKECTILNSHYINFSEAGNKFKAESKMPIRIRNNALGYNLECVLKYFEYDNETGSLEYSVYPKFTEIISSDKDSLENFIRKRKLAFIGSAAHLLSSLAAGEYKFRDEGFELKKNALVINKASEIVFCDSLTQKYYLRFDGCIRIQYWKKGKRTFSILCLKYGSTQFNPAGYFIYPGEFSFAGEMAKEGIATILPRFLDIKDDDK